MWDTSSKFNSTSGGVLVPVAIIRDPAYPLLLWLVKPYPGVGLNAKKKKVNTRLSRACVVVECAFGRLKDRWRSLLKRNDVKVDNMTAFVTACCILHNLCEVHQGSFDEQWLDEVQASNHSSLASASTIPSCAATLRETRTFDICTNNSFWC